LRNVAKEFQSKARGDKKLDNLLEKLGNNYSNKIIQQNKEIKVMAIGNL
jgi:hypothetical protein